MIKTTVNFLESRLDAVFEAANVSGIEYKVLIKRCVACFVDDFEKGDFAENALKYQPDADNWKKVHVKMSPDEYDIYFDCKKVLRWSFSLIVAVAIDMYLDSIVNGYQDYSYHADTYTKFCMEEEKIPIYVFSWGKSMKLEEILEKLRE
jgi:hypothetical protein